MTIKYAEGVPIYPKGLHHRDANNKPVPTGEQNPMPVVLVTEGEGGGEPSEGIPYAEGVPIYPAGEFHRNEHNEPVATGHQNPMPVIIRGGEAAMQLDEVADRLQKTMLPSNVVLSEPSSIDTEGEVTLEGDAALTVLGNSGVTLDDIEANDITVDGTARPSFAVGVEGGYDEATEEQVDIGGDNLFFEQGEDGRWTVTLRDGDVSVTTIGTYDDVADAIAAVRANDDYEIGMVQSIGAEDGTVRHIYVGETQVYPARPAAGAVHWDAVRGKPRAYPPMEHTHSEFVPREELESPEWIGRRIDRMTVEQDEQSGELSAVRLRGLHPSATELNEWLQGTEGNIQQQIDGLSDTLAAVTAGMRYRGKFETHAELQGVGAMENGDLAVVLADETRSGARTMYVYRDDLGMWEFVGAFEFSDAFTALSDTPNGYDDGKFLRSTDSGLVYGMPTWDDVQDRPDRTKAQIEQAVDRAHEHGNKPALDRIGIDAQGRITIDGVPYVPAAPARQYRYARRSSDMEHGLNHTIRFDQHVSGNIPITSQGAFTLSAGRTYHVMANLLLEMTGWVRVALVDTETGSTPPEAPNGAIIHSVTSSFNESSNGCLSVIITPTTTRNFGIRFLARSGSSTVVRGAFSTLTIIEI